MQNFALAGGVALNCTGNGFLCQQDFVENLFVQPASHDGGTALGAAILAYKEFNGSWPNLSFAHPYWGSHFSQEQIYQVLNQENVQFREVDPVEECVKSLEDNLVVGFFQGRSEVGPRALGNRSILANPTFRDNLDRVNEIKRREKWRPLAPSMTEEDYFSIVECQQSSPFMLIATQVAQDYQSKIPAVVHIDGSCRPQAVSRKTNEIYHSILSKLKSRIGAPVVLNTSFNVKGEPIVDSPTDALRTFRTCGLDKLIIGNFCVEK